VCARSQRASERTRQAHEERSTFLRHARPRIKETHAHGTSTIIVAGLRVVKLPVKCLLEVLFCAVQVPVLHGLQSACTRLV
jgi:hypothetical protein